MQLSISKHKKQNVNKNNSGSRVYKLVKMCYTRLKQVIDSEKMEIHLITLENYKEYVTFPEHITQKFEQKIITMTTLSDILRMCLLSIYGGMWVDATVFFTDSIP